MWEPGGTIWDEVFTLTIIDPCHSSAIELQNGSVLTRNNTFPFPDSNTYYHLETSLKKGTENGGAGTPITLAFDHHWDTISTLYEPADGSKVCRDRGYVLTNLDATADNTNFLTID